MAQNLRRLGFAATVLIVLILSFNMLREPSRQQDTLTDRQRAAIARATGIYASYCLECHGAFGEGLNQNLPLNDRSVRNQDASELFKTISRGRLNTAMVAWSVNEGGIFTDTQIDDLVTLIKYGSWRQVQAYVDAQGLTPTEVPPIEQQFDLDALTHPLEVVSAGRSVYLANCFSCHNPGTAGTTSHSIGKQLTDNSFIQDSSDEDLLVFVQEGRTKDDPDNVTGNEMPARGSNPNLTDDEILTVIAYLRELNAGTATLVLDQQGEAPAVTTWNGFNYRWVKVVDNLDIPLLATHAGDGSGRIFVVEQMGRIMIVADGALNPEPFLDINNLLPVGVQHGIYTEQGLLGLAFHPNYAENGLFFVSYSNHAGDSVIARYRVSLDDPNRADPDSQVILLTVDQPFEDHNGGNIVFGPDGYLYIGFGDGGRPAEPNYNSQRPDVYLGKMLRIDVNAETYTVPADNPFVDDPEFLPEIWAWGLRNPWRFTFDRETGDLFIGDVGQWLIEELDFQPGTSTGGENYGWSAFEGNQPYLEDETVRSEHTPPIHQYFHDVGSSITGGYVYRGQALPGLWGEYIYGDYVSGVIWIGHFDETGAWVNETFMDSGFVISSFGEDEQGELLLVDYKGAVYRLEAGEPIEAEPETETEPGAEAGEATGTGAAGD